MLTLLHLILLLLKPWSMQFYLLCLPSPNLVDLIFLFVSGKPTKALDTLYDVIKSKKRNHNYSEKLIEEIMYKYLELCVDLKKSHIAKEGLFQYRNMCQSVNVASLAAVVQVICIVFGRWMGKRDEWECVRRKQLK